MSRYPPIKYGGGGASGHSTRPVMEHTPSTISQNNAQSRRNVEIEAFLSQYPSARQLKPDRSLLLLPIQLRNGQIISINIQIPPRFPEVFNCNLIFQIIFK